MKIKYPVVLVLFLVFILFFEISCAGNLKKTQNTQSATEPDSNYRSEVFWVNKNFKRVAELSEKVMLCTGFIKTFKKDKYGFNLTYPYITPWGVINRPKTFSPNNSCIAIWGWFNSGDMTPLYLRTKIEKEIQEKYREYDGHHFITIENLVKEKIIYVIDSPGDHIKQKGIELCHYTHSVCHMEFDRAGEYLYWAWNYPFKKEPESGINRFNLKTQEIEQLYYLPDRYIGNFRVSPNGNIIWLEETMGSEPYKEEFLYYVKNKKKVLLNGSKTFQTDFTPDGKYIAISLGEKGNDQILLVDTNDVSRRKKIDVYDRGFGLSISPNGKWLTAYNSREKALYFYSLQTDEKQQVLRFKGNRDQKGGLYLKDPVWSQDSKFFAGEILWGSIGIGYEWVIINLEKKEVFFRSGGEGRSNINFITNKEVIRKIHEFRIEEQKTIEEEHRKEIERRKQGTRKEKK